MYPCFETIRTPARSRIKKSLGGHVKVRFANRDGKFYCTVIDEQSGVFDNRTLTVIRESILAAGAETVELTSAGGGHYTCRFRMEEYRT